MIAIREAKQKAGVRRVVLDDHTRLPARFFGRLTASVAAGRL